MVTEDIRQRIVSYLEHQAKKDVPALLDLIEGSRARLLALLDGLSEEQAAFRSAPDRWSIADVVRHVTAAEESVASVVDSLAGGAAPEGRRTTGSQTAEEGEPLAALVERLRAARVDLLERVRGWPASSDLTVKFEHPFFGLLDCKAWVAFQRVHDLDHIGQIEQVKASEGYPDG